MVSVLITRPQTASEALAEILQQHGYEGVIESMLAIKSTDMPPPDLSEIQALMITSANALTALGSGDYETESLLHYPCFCVGPRTEAQARLFGFTKTYSSASDGAALARLIDQTLFNKKKSILHMAARDTDSKAHNELTTLGFAVRSWPIYRAEPAESLSPPLIKLLQQKKIDAALVFSVRTAETLVKLIKQHALETCCNQLVAIGLSQAVIDALLPLNWHKTAAAETPTEDAVIKCLAEIFPI